MKSLELGEAAKIRQILALSEMVSDSCRDPRTFLQRSCQAACHLLGKSAAAVLQALPDFAEIAAFYGDPRARDMIAAWLETARQAPAHLAHPTTMSLAAPAGGPGRLLLLPFCGTRTLAVVGDEDTPFSADEVWSAQCLAAVLGASFGHLVAERELAASAREALEAIVAMAHDLRSPLNVILGYANLLSEGAYGPVNPSQREILSTMAKRGESLLSLLAAAMDLARVEVGAGATKPTEVPLDEIIREVISSAASRRSNDEVALEWSVDPKLPHLTIERAYLEHILQNLTDNALKATERGKIQIRATLEETENRVRITVSDTGRGIEPQRVPHLFELFQGTDGPSRSRAAYGCGLFLVRKFCERLGAKLDVSTRLGEGTSFSVLLPIDPKLAQQPQG